MTNIAKFNTSKIARAVALAVLPAALVVGCAGKDPLVKSEASAAIASEQMISLDNQMQAQAETQAETTELSMSEIIMTAVNDEADATSIQSLEQAGDGETITAWEATINETETTEQVQTESEQVLAAENAESADGMAAESPIPTLQGEVRDSRYMDVNLIMPDVDAIQAPEQFVFHFASNAFDIDQASLDELNKHARYLRQNPDMALNINGFSDSRGSAAYNYKLSKKRAQVIEKALLALGVSQSQLTVNGYGESFPLSDENNYDENRRVELEYIERDTSVMASKIM